MLVQLVLVLLLLIINIVMMQLIIIIIINMIIARVVILIANSVAVAYEMLVMLMARWVLAVIKHFAGNTLPGPAS